MSGETSLGGAGGEAVAAVDWRAEVFRGQYAGARPLPLRRARRACRRAAAVLLDRFAPVLRFLPADERLRVEALVAWAALLAGIAGREGTVAARRSEIARWRQRADDALRGRPGRQPVPVALGAVSRFHPWPRGTVLALADLVASWPGEEAGSARFEALARALGEALFAGPLPSELALWGGSLLELVRMVRQAPDVGSRREACHRIRPRLIEGSRAILRLPKDYERAAVFLTLAALRLLALAEEGVPTPRLGRPAVLALVLRARYRPLGGLLDAQP